MTVEKGAPWERPASGPPDWEVAGDDAALAALVGEHPHGRIGFVPSPASDLSRALGLGPAPRRGLDLPIDALRIDADGHARLAVNMAVIGVAPDRMSWASRTIAVTVIADGRVVHESRGGGAVSVVVANGQYLRSLDVVPRGHPGDGRMEVQVYTPARGERGAVRSRLPQGTHLPHPRIAQTTARRVEVVTTGRPVRLEIDGAPAPAATRITVEVIPEAFSLVV